METVKIVGVERPWPATLFIDPIGPRAPERIEWSLEVYGSNGEVIERASGVNSPAVFAVIRAALEPVVFCTSELTSRTVTRRQS